MGQHTVLSGFQRARMTRSILMPVQTLLLLVLVLLYCCSSGAFASAGAGSTADPHVGGLGMHLHRIDARYWLPVGALMPQLLRRASASSTATVTKSAEESCCDWLLPNEAVTIQEIHCMTARLFIVQTQFQAYGFNPLHLPHGQALALLPAVPLAFFLWEECCRASRRRSGSISGAPVCPGAALLHSVFAAA